MSKLNAQTLPYLVICAICAVVLSIVLTHSSPDMAVASLGTFVTVLCVQIAFLQRQISTLKDEMSASKRS